MYYFSCFNGKNYHKEVSRNPCHPSQWWKACEQPCWHWHRQTDWTLRQQYAIAEWVICRNCSTLDKTVLFWPRVWEGKARGSWLPWKRKHTRASNHEKYQTLRQHRTEAQEQVRFWNHNKRSSENSTQRVPPRICGAWAWWLASSILCKANCVWLKINLAVKGTGANVWPLAWTIKWKRNHCPKIHHIFQMWLQVHLWSKQLSIWQAKAGASFPAPLVDLWWVDADKRLFKLCLSKSLPPERHRIHNTIEFAWQLHFTNAKLVFCNFQKQWFWNLQRWNDKSCCYVHCSAEKALQQITIGVVVQLFVLEKNQPSCTGYTC